MTRSVNLTKAEQQSDIVTPTAHDERKAQGVEA